MALKRQIFALSRRVVTEAAPRHYLGKRLCNSVPTKQIHAPSSSILSVRLLRSEQRRWHTTPPDLKPGKQYNFSSIQKLVESPNHDVILIDVREPNEYAAGYIPTALNVPISSQPDAFHLPTEEFFDRFGFEKPSTEKEIVMYCKAGVRSRAAAQLAGQNGYKKVGEYPGSWLDWQKNGGKSSSDP